MRNLSIRSWLPFFTFCASLLSLGLAACGGGQEKEPVQPLTLAVDFSEGAIGWAGGAADYNVGNPPDDVITSISSLPSPLPGSGYRLSGTNESDDLFVFAKRQFSGLNANTTYQLVFSVSIATWIPQNCVGVGGAPGESVYLVAGAANTEPLSVLDGAGSYRVSWERGNQATGGPQAAVLGNIANSQIDCPPTSEWVWEVKTLNQNSPLSVTSDGDGRLWVLLGMDSGFEHYSEVYLLSATATLTPLGQ